MKHRRLAALDEEPSERIELAAFRAGELAREPLLLDAPDADAPMPQLLDCRRHPEGFVVETGRVAFLVRWSDKDAYERLLAMIRPELNAGAVGSC